MPPAFQEQMARLGGFDIVRVDSGHSPHFSVPNDVIAVITGVIEASS